MRQVNMSDSKALAMPDLKTERLHIRCLRIEDAPALLEILSDPETVRYWGRPAMSQLEEAEAYTQENLDWMTQGHCLYWGLEEAGSGKMIGTCALLRMDLSNRRAEVGYLLHRSFWRRGIMTEALQRVIQYAFEELKLHRLEADTDPDNLSSIQLLERFGFQREGLFKDRWYVDGKWSDSLMLGLISQLDSENAGAS
jgi:RimJ/RimL family protein N-acetyltransferase